MSSSAMISVPTTASRFALLQIDSDSDSEGRSAGKTGRDPSGKTRPGKPGAGGKAAQTNDKKKDKKKKKKDQQQCEVNELRSLAFKKIPQKSSAPPPPPPPTLQSVANVLLNPGSGDQGPPPPEGWQQWKQRDEQITSELYEADLEKALILSKQDFEQHKHQKTTDTSSPKSRGGKEGGGGKKEKKKGQQGKDKKTVSLQNFQTDGAAEHLGKKQEKEESRAANAGPDERFFNKLEDDVSKIVQREKRREQYSNSPGQETNTSTEHEPDPRAEQLRYDLEKKDQEIEKLKTTISQWEVKYKEVKARNAQLLKMLQQGEMKDKAEILLHVDELLNIKEELSSQVKLLHAALEQEKSKVKGLQSDQPKHQGNKRGKKGSECDL